MIDIRPLAPFTPSDLLRVAAGYTSFIRYAIDYTDEPDTISLTARRVVVDEPYVKEWEFDDEELERYDRARQTGYSFGAYDGRRLVGVVIAEPHTWNGSIWVWEFHVAPTHQQQGIGRRLMDTLAAAAAAGDFRVLVCEVQHTNGVGIDTYRRLGFRLEGMDLSYYSNEDHPDGEVAVFMKRRVGE
jgi:ribosomal protein S18 acetylase RimI-like enzyme